MPREGSETWSTVDGGALQVGGGVEGGSGLEGVSTRFLGVRWGSKGRGRGPPLFFGSNRWRVGPGPRGGGRRGHWGYSACRPGGGGAAGPAGRGHSRPIWGEEQGASAQKNRNPVTCPFTIFEFLLHFVTKSMFHRPRPFSHAPESSNSVKLS